MDILLTEWLAVGPPLGDERTRLAVTTALLTWKALPPPVCIEVAGAVEATEESMPEAWRGRYHAELGSMEKEWDAMRQAVADKHVSVYEHKDRVVGYVFCGAQNDDQMTIKWIVCGTKAFTEEFQNVQKEAEQKRFNKSYTLLKEKTPYREVDALDATYKEHRYQRVCKFSAPKHDSGWIKI